MHFLLKSISYIFHPVIMPLLGVTFYFSKSRRFIPQEIIYAKLVSTTILTVILPILLLFLLKTMRKINSVYLLDTKERILPFILNCIITLLVIKRVFPPTEIIELYYFFLGILISTLSCLILALLNYKASIHMVAISGFFMFAIGISLHFSINVNKTLAALAIISGAIATSRLHLKAHTINELIIGMLIGLLPQLLLFNYWL